MLLFRVRVLKDQRAFEVLYDRHYEQIYRFCRTKLPSKNDAQDATSQTFLSAWNYLSNSIVEESLTGLLYTIARGTIARFYQKRKQIDELSTYADPVGVTDGQIEAQVDLGLVRNTLNKLKDDYQQVIIMRYFDDLSLEDIAKSLHRSQGAVRVLLHRALKELRTHL